MGQFRQRPTITELFTSRALDLEGRARRHYLTTYAERCDRMQASIWSMQVDNARGRHRVGYLDISRLPLA